ncbi:helix-turn-helix domain-containing protein [Bacillus wiedmannii]|uniref:helix-turn-helix domain-containing protein n=1 Tax=Bacillus wiedmannii TaxID=1890302 RepID=UPI003CF63A6F
MISKQELNDELRTQWKSQQTKYGTPLVFFANKVGFSKTTIRRWILGEFNFSIGSAQKVSDYLNR